MFLVADYWSEYSKIMDYKELRLMLIEELENDVKDNIEEKEIINSDLKQLCELAKTDTQSIKYLVENLESFGWHVFELQDLHCTLNYLRRFLYNKTEQNKDCIKYIAAIDDIIQLIDDKKLLDGTISINCSISKKE